MKFIHKGPTSKVYYWLYLLLYMEIFNIKIIYQIEEINKYILKWLNYLNHGFFLINREIIKEGMEKKKIMVSKYKKFK